MEDGEKGRAPSLDDVMRAVLPEDMPMHPDHPMQQAEPAPSKYSDVVSDGGMDPRNAPAPAQDERESYSSTLTQGELNLVRTVLSGTVTDELVSRVTSALAARPAQAEQQPVAWRWMYNGESDGPYAFNYPLPDDDVVRRGLMAARPRTVQPLYAAPVAQTAPQQGVQLADTRRSRIYLAGPMTGIADYNFPAFNAEADRLREQGYHVENPADHGVVEGADWADYLRYDIGRLATCECIHLLPGWSQSSGAKLEVSIAKALGMHILYAEGAETSPQPEQSGLVDALTQLLCWAEKQVCTHEETHRGGAIWEICDSCGAKWADDEGGRPAFVWPKAISNASAALSAQGESHE